MRFHCMLLLIDIYLQSRVRAGVVGVGNSKIAVADTSTSQLISTDLGDVPLKRMLRYTDELDEERAGLPVSAAEKVTSSLASSEVTSSTLIRWINDKKSMDAVFTRLKLTNAGDKLFENPVFLTWLNYADELSAKLGKKTSPITTLTAQYGDETLSKMISAAKTVPATKDIATKMQVEQIQLWLRNGKSPVDVFKLLGLSTARNDLLASPELSTWTKYMKLFNNEYPEKKTTLIATLSTTYGDEAVSKILDAAKKVPSTERIATSLEKARLQYWFDQGKTIASVFTLLKLDKENSRSTNLFTMGYGNYAPTLMMKPHQIHNVHISIAALR
ncbi:unnamed protein product [Phytophthora lilii]|uniref:Unnamed protein product n=1 Tax=Phytophthora lilii TaxID=2077276 RepID=A0A9W6TCP6_9STRA|nr:unnamed protein product [Phytophthora lilii]